MPELTKTVKKMYFDRSILRILDLMMSSEINRASTTFVKPLDSVEQIEKWWNDNPLAVGLAFVGRSNVGKSSLINSLFGKKTAKTSKTPGRTQKINIFTFNIVNKIKTEEGEVKKELSFFLYDLPGYGHAEVNKAMSRNWQIIMDTFFNTLNGRTLLVNLQDCRHPNQKMDMKFYDYINPDLVEIFLVFNKLDKLKKQKERAALNKLKPQIYKDYKHVKQIFFVSAEKKEGIPPLELALISYLHRIHDSDEEFVSIS